jgi:hypothetical protein
VEPQRGNFCPHEDTKVSHLFRNLAKLLPAEQMNAPSGGACCVSAPMTENNKRSVTLYIITAFVITFGVVAALVLLLV